MMVDDKEDATEDFGDWKYKARNSTTVSNDFAYDARGRMIQNLHDGIKEVQYTAYNKVKKVVPLDANRPTIEYEYDAMGNRIIKKESYPTRVAITRYTYDASGVLMAVYEGNAISEIPIYGSGRLGSYRPGAGAFFELTNHLGSITAVVKDKLKADGSGADIVSLSDYYPGGMDMPGRQYNNSTLLGYQGSLKASELGANQYTTYFRELDTRILRWSCPDPVNQPWQSPYCVMGNNPVAMVDPLGNTESVSVGGGWSDNLTISVDNSSSGSSGGGSSGGGSGGSSGGSVMSKIGSAVSAAVEVVASVAKSAANAMSNINSSAIIAVNINEGSPDINIIKEEGKDSDKKVDYKHQGDVYFSEENLKMQVFQKTNECFITALAYASYLLSSDEKKNVVLTVLSQIRSYEKETKEMNIDITKDRFPSDSRRHAFINKHFKTKNVNSYFKPIDSGHPVIGSMIVQQSEKSYGLHAVLIVGYNKLEGVLIYIDPGDGQLYRRDPAEFNLMHLKKAKDFSPSETFFQDMSPLELIELK